MYSDVTNEVVNRSENDSRNNSGQQHAQPVVSLLEKYSTLHRGIDEARKEHAERQKQIEFIEGNILRLVDVNRIANKDSIETSVQEKEALLRTLEKLIETALLEAQEAEALARSKRDFVRYKEDKAIRTAQDDRDRFLNTSKVFREKIRTLSLRGELFDLKSPVALVAVNKILQDTPSKSLQMMIQKEKDANEDGDFCSSNHFDSLLLQMDIQKNDDYSGGKNKNIEYNHDDEIEELLEQLGTQNDLNKKREKAFKQQKIKHQNLLRVKGKREKEKKNLQSQYDRLKRDCRDVESKIENLHRQTTEATEMISQFRNESECCAQIDTSKPNSDYPAKNITANETNELPNSTNGNSMVPRKKATKPYNPYARTNRRKNSASIPTAKSNTSITTNTTPQTLPICSKENKQDINRKRSQMMVDENACHYYSPHTNDNQSKTPKRNRQQSSLRSRRSSRRFGESSFRAPSKALMRSTFDQNNELDDCIAGEEHTTKSESKKVEQKSRGSPILEDTDEDDDDAPWLSTTPFLSSSGQTSS